MSYKPLKLRLTNIILIGLGSTLCSCVAVGPDYQKPKLSVVDLYQTSGFVNAPEPGARDSIETMNESVWGSVNDSLLQDLLIQVEKNHTDIQIAINNLLLAKGIDRDSKLDRLPQPVTHLDSVEKRDSERKSFPAEKGGETYQDHTLTESITWELDWIGRLKRLNESTQANVDKLTAELAQVQLLSRAELVRQYAILRGTQAQLLATNANADRQKDTWSLTQSRFDAGVATPVDVARAKSQYYATLATVPPLESRMKRALHRIALLTGRGASESYSQLLQSRPIPDFSRAAQVGLDPKSLLEQRPDVRAAEARLRSATAEIGMTQALWYPQVSLVGDVGFASENFNNLADSESIFSVLGVNIRWAGLGFSRVNVGVNRSKANANIAYEQYRKAVLTAFEEVENAWVEYHNAQSVSEHLKESAGSAKKAAQLAQQQYEGGVIAFIEVLDAERRQLELEDQLANAQTQTALAVVNLYLSLAVM